MEIALIVVGLIALGLGVGVFVLLMGVSAERARSSSLSEQLAGANARMENFEGERARLVGELESARGEVVGLESEVDQQTARITELSIKNAEFMERLDAAERARQELIKKNL